MLEINVSKKAIGVVLALILVAGCGSQQPQPDTQADAGTEAVDTGAEATGAGSDTGIGSETMDDAASLETVFYFDFDQSSLRPETRAALDAQAARLRNTSGAIRLEGHADERGSREYNLALGERRAKAVADYLAIQGISRSRIETVSYGEERPVAFGKDENSYQLNRRVELK